MKYDKIYKNNSNVWGSKPNKLLQRIYGQVNAGSEFLDLGCGQGRDSLFMLQKGLKVTAIDSSQKGIDDIKKQINNLSSSDINLLCEKMETFEIIKDKYAVINIFNSLHFLLKKDALKLIKNVKENIKSDGYVVVCGFTIDDPSYNQSNYYFEPQELKKIFFDFNIILYGEKEMLDKGHLGKPEPHKHNIVEMIAQKIKPAKQYKHEA